MIKRIFLKSPVISFAFLASFVYWVYLVFNTGMIIEYDAISYERLGRIIAEHGWLEFFKTGPNREPFYPLLVAISMKLGKSLGISYYHIQAVIQLLTLLGTQIFVLYILRRILKVNDRLSALAIFYLGFSPAMVNSALSLYSEIAVYPFVLAGMLLINASWMSFNAGRQKLIALGIISGVTFVLLTLNRTIFELITPIFIFLILISIVGFHDWRRIKKALLWVLVFSAVFYSLISGYKFLNKKFNGSFTVADRGARVVYGNTAVRMTPLNAEKFLTNLASAPGEGICKSLFGEDKCRRWSCWNCDPIGSQKANELKNRGLSDQEAVRELFVLTRREFLKNPLQYFLMGFVEGLKMLFWESSQVGFVAYPAWLIGIFNWLPFRYGLRLVMFILTLFSLIYTISHLWRERKKMLNSPGDSIFLYLCLLFIFSFIASYSISCILVRYIFPIVPLYIIITTFVFHDLLKSRKECAE